MKGRRSIFGFVVVVAVVAALLYWFAEKKPVETPLATPVTTASLPPVAAVPNTPPASPAQIVSNSTTGGASQSVPSVSQEKVTLLKQILQGNNANIIFYGLLEDQSGTVVSSAKVNFSIQYEDANARGIHRGQVVSDANGFFTISGTGATLGIIPEKMGYALATTGTSFRYSQLTPGYFVPDANNPTIIKMWKLQGPEPLVSINQRYKVHFTDSPINFDLLAGKMVPAGGDIKLTVSRSAGVISGRNRLDWGVQVEAVDGGVMDSGGQDDVTYAAPADGYQQNMAFMFSTNGQNNWYEEFNQGFFVMSRNGQVYSKLGLTFRINRMPDDFMYITFSGVASTNGSRNWEAAFQQ
jgi:hypothetical protein